MPAGGGGGEEAVIWSHQRSRKTEASQTVSGLMGLSRSQLCGSASTIRWWFWILRRRRLSGQNCTRTCVLCGWLKWFQFQNCMFVCSFRLNSCHHLEKNKKTNKQKKLHYFAWWPCYSFLTLSRFTSQLCTQFLFFSVCQYLSINMLLIAGPVNIVKSGDQWVHWLTSQTSKTSQTSNIRSR